MSVSIEKKNVIENGTVIKNLGQVVAIRPMNDAATVLEYKIKFPVNALSNAYRTSDWVSQVVIDTYTM